MCPLRRVSPILLFMSEPAIAEPEVSTNPRLLPPYHVLIENDDDHSQLFVILVLRKVFGYDEPKAIDLMSTAEQAGEAVVWTGAKEVAELKLEQIHTYHEKHWRDDRDLGPIRARIEPAT
jgi:ATP-dependent Clp protease adaptor protein ClpS